MFIVPVQGKKVIVEHQVQGARNPLPGRFGPYRSRDHHGRAISGGRRPRGQGLPLAAETAFGAYRDRVLDQVRECCRGGDHSREDVGLVLLRTLVRA